MAEPRGETPSETMNLIGWKTLALSALPGLAIAYFTGGNMFWWTVGTMVLGTGIKHFMASNDANPVQALFGGASKKDNKPGIARSREIESDAPAQSQEQTVAAKPHPVLEDAKGAQTPLPTPAASVAEQRSAAIPARARTT